MNDNKDFNMSLNGSQDKDKDDKEKEDIIVKNFPNWDLLPPYQTVRRINRQ
jgi:hypothetical protein